MAGSKVSIDSMADAIMKELNAYADTTADGVKTAVQKAAKTVKSEIQAGAPVKTGAYEKSWAAKNTAESAISLPICWNMVMPSAAAAEWRQDRILQRQNNPA